MDPVEVQQTLLRFADEYLMRMVDRREPPSARHQRAVSRRNPETKIALGTETCSIVSGPNAVANLLDMTVFVTVMRMALEDYWQPKVFGDSALPCLNIPGAPRPKSGGWPAPC